MCKKKHIYTVFDVGANEGKYTKLIHSVITNAEIYAFEPHYKTYKLLNENVKAIQNVKTFNIAVSDKISKLKLFDYIEKDGSGHASLNSEIFSTVHKASTISHEVEAKTIDVISEENKLKQIDFLKIDVEGHELEVLKGAKKMLSNKKISIIQFEFTQLNTTIKVFFKDFYELLSDNYKIYRLLPNNMLEIKTYNPTFDEIFGYQNYVAILKKI